MTSTKNCYGEHVFYQVIRKETKNGKTIKTIYDETGWPGSARWTVKEKNDQAVMNGWKIRYSYRKVEMNAGQFIKHMRDQAEKNILEKVMKADKKGESYYAWDTWRSENSKNGRAIERLIKAKKIKRVGHEYTGMGQTIVYYRPVK